MYDEPITLPAGHVPGDGFVVPAPTRVVVAVDVDGRRYQMPLGGGQPAGTAQVSEPGTPPPGPAPDRRQGDRQAALTALAHLVDVATATPGPPPDAAGSGSAGEAGRDVLVPGELVTVAGDRWDDDQRRQLWVVVDHFGDYTIAVLGGDGYQWGHIPRGELTPVAPEWIRRVIRDDRTYGYTGADSIEQVPRDDGNPPATS